jgi:DNA-binding SARP family transcriptional activator/TolB-like protein
VERPQQNTEPVTADLTAQKISGEFGLCEKGSSVTNLAMSRSDQWLEDVQKSSSNGDQHRLQLRLIGPMAAWTPTQEFELPKSRKGRALLAVVALSEPTRALRHTLAELLWDRRTEEHSRASLRQEIHRLMETLSRGDDGDVLIVNRDHLALRSGMLWTDAGEVMRATVGKPEALTLLDGTLLEGLDRLTPNFDLWLSSQRERLHDHARAIAEGLLSAETPEKAMVSAQRLLAIDRVHEGACRLLMGAYANRGEKGLAVEAYERFRVALSKLRGTEPSSETEALLKVIRGSAPVEVHSRSEIRGPEADPAEKRLRLDLPASNADAGASDEDASKPARLPHEPARDCCGSTTSGPRVGVMPLRRVGGTDDLADMAAETSEQITGALARLRWLFVVSSATLAQYAQSRGVEIAVRQTFGIDLLIDGTIRREANRVRVTMRLIDLRENNRIVWVRDCERTDGDLLTLQDEVAATAAAQLDSEILMHEARRTRSLPVEAATAAELVLRSLPLITRLERRLFMQGGTYLARAIDLDADCASAHAWYAYWHIFMVGQRWSDGPNSMILKAWHLAERAITLDPYDARALTIAGHVRAFLQHRLHEGAALHARAISLNPNLAMAWALSAVTHAYMGETVEAERLANRGKTLSPLDPHAFMFEGSWALIHLLKRDYEPAVVAGRVTTELTPSLAAGFKPYLAALGHLGCKEEAAQARERLLAIEPTFSIDRFMRETPLLRERDRQHFAEGLRLADIPQN